MSFFFLLNEYKLQNIRLHLTRTDKTESCKSQGSYRQDYVVNKEKNTHKYKLNYKSGKAVLVKQGSTKSGGSNNVFDSVGKNCTILSFCQICFAVQQKVA